MTWRIYHLRWNGSARSSRRCSRRYVCVARWPSCWRCKTADGCSRLSLLHPHHTTAAWACFGCPRLHTAQQLHYRAFAGALASLAPGPRLPRVSGRRFCSIIDGGGPGRSCDLVRKDRGDASYPQRIGGRVAVAEHELLGIRDCAPDRIPGCEGTAACATDRRPGPAAERRVRSALIALIPGSSPICRRSLCRARAPQPRPGTHAPPVLFCRSAAPT